MPRPLGLEVIEEARQGHRVSHYKRSCAGVGVAASPELLRLPAELARVDALLDDPVFFAPFAPYFHPVPVRPAAPVECYLRLMFGKFRYRLGYESLCAEVSDSISWRRFCRIGLDGRVPHPTTLMKLTTRCGEAAVAGLNEALWAKAAGARLLRTARVRADTTVIGANVAYPTDCGLLAKAVGKLVRAARRVQAAGGATGTVMTDRRRAAGRRAREMAATMRVRARLGREEGSRAIGRATGDLPPRPSTARTRSSPALPATCGTTWQAQSPAGWRGTPVAPSSSCPDP